MSDVLRWCAIEALKALPMVGAYYLGRWAQRRDARRSAGFSR